MKPSHLHQRSHTSHTHRRKRGVLVRYASLLFGLVLLASLSACDAITVTPAWEEPLETPEQRAAREAAQAERLAAREAAQAERRAAQEERRAAKEAAQEEKRLAKETGTGEGQQPARRLLGGNQDADKEAAREEKQAAREAARQERLAAREAAAQARAAARGEETAAQGEEAGAGEEQQSVRRLFGGNTDPDKEAAREEKQAAREAARQERLAAREAAAQAKAAARAAADAQGAVTDAQGAVAAQGAAAGVGAGQRSARRLRGGNADPDKEAAREEKRVAREAARQERLAAREAARQKRLAAKEATRAGDGAPEEMETAADAGQMARIGELLALGDEALKNDRLTVPAGESAVDRYNQILEIDPNNDGAKQGIDRVVDRYIVLARGAMDDSNWPRAKQMASRAGSVGPHRSEPGELEQQIDLMSQVTSDSIEFAQADVRNQDEGVANQILAFGAVAKYKGARVEIRTPNNKDGRWMFDQLNEAPGTGRVRAFFTNGSPPKITLSGGE